MPDVSRGPAKHRSLPLLSRLVIFPLHLLCAVLHTITRPFGRDVESAVNLLITGGFFGLVIVPILFYGLVIRCIERLLELYVFGDNNDTDINLIQYLSFPLVLCYIIQVLILDKDHLKAELAAPIPPQNFVERIAEQFYVSGLDYNNIQCIPWSDDAQLPPTRQYIFAVHPHGIHCMPLSLFTTYGSDFDKKFPNLVGHKITGLAATIIFKLPMVREIFLRWGYVDASRSVAHKVLNCGRSVLVCTGGEEESMYTAMGRDIVVLKNRMGFVRLALAHGADIVPVFGVGNSDTYRTYGFMASQRRWLQKTTGIALPIFHGRFLTPLPYKVPIRVLIGKPIATPKPKATGERPDEQLVKEYHKKYIEALKELHSKHVHDRVLEIR